jgi:hypothetical protein
MKCNVNDKGRLLLNFFELAQRKGAIPARGTTRRMKVWRNWRRL